MNPYLYYNKKILPNLLSSKSVISKSKNLNPVRRGRILFEAGILPFVAFLLLFSRWPKMLKTTNKSTLGGSKINTNRLSERFFFDSKGPISLYIISCFILPFQRESQTWPVKFVKTPQGLTLTQFSVQLQQCYLPNFFNKSWLYTTETFPVEITFQLDSSYTVAETRFILQLYQIPAK